MAQYRGIVNVFAHFERFMLSSKPLLEDAGWIEALDEKDPRLDHYTMTTPAKTDIRFARD